MYPVNSNQYYQSTNNNLEGSKSSENISFQKINKAINQRFSGKYDAVSLGSVAESEEKTLSLIKKLTKRDVVGDDVDPFYDLMLNKHLSWGAFNKLMEKIGRIQDSLKLRYGSPYGEGLIREDYFFKLLEHVDSSSLREEIRYSRFSTRDYD